jgi:tetratricopeptide (TPR) repeat protein
MIECNRLSDLEEYPQLFRIEDDRKFRLAQHLKNLGVENFKKNLLEEAFRNFTEAIKLLVILDGKDGYDVPEELGQAKIELKLTLYNNVAGCHVLKKNWELAIDLCNSVLEKQPANVKALYRRGWSRMEMEDYELARQNLEKALEVDPKNQAVRQKLGQLSAREKSLNAKYASAMKKMFS